MLSKILVSFVSMVFILSSATISNADSSKTDSFLFLAEISMSPREVIETAQGQSAVNETIWEGPTFVAKSLDLKFQNQSPPIGSQREFSTDFSRATINYGDVIAGGPPKDGIPSIDQGVFVSVEEADNWIMPAESVFVVTNSQDDPPVTHVYPVQILIWHEIVNDMVGSLPVTITYCPLCNTGAAFLRNFDGYLLDFGVSGRLRYSNMIMYDRQTETWWQQATGKGIAGRYAGGGLLLLPMLSVSWREVKRNWPDAMVLSRDTGHSRTYGRNPYNGYDTSPSPFLYRGPSIDPQYNSLSRVVALFHNNESRPYPYDLLRENSPINDNIGGDSVTIFWQSGVASPLDSSNVGTGRDVGTANIFLASLPGYPNLTFTQHNEIIKDDQTDSSWSVGGVALDGPLQDMRLVALPTVQHFWFSWNAFDLEAQ